MFIIVLLCSSGCELSSGVPFYTFQADEDEDVEHFLELRTVCRIFKYLLNLLKTFIFLSPFIFITLPHSTSERGFNAEANLKHSWAICFLF